MASNDKFESSLDENSRFKLLGNTVREIKENELNSCIENASQKSQIIKRHSENIRSCFDIVKNENELRKRHEQIKKVSIDSFIAEISDGEEDKETKIKQFCKDIDKDFELLISGYKTLYEKLDSEQYQALEKAKLIYIQEMDKHFIKQKFMYAKKLNEMHEKSKSLSHKKLEKSLTSSPLNTILEENFNDSIEKIYDQYKRQNLASIPLNPVIGIDLGTTYSCAGVMKKGKFHIISDKNGLNNSPSYISFTPNGEAIVGIEAKEMAHENPNNTIYDVKRMIGRKYNDINIQENMKLWPFEVVNENNTLKVKLKLSDNKTLYPEELASKILLKVKSEADKYLEFKVNQGVITVPVYFNDAQRHATGFAGLLAGVNILQILNEPTAAAIAYSHQMKCDSSKNILIYDLGGSTFDVSVVVIENEIIDIKAIGGDKHLGGVDFDQRVLDFFYDTYKHKFSEALNDAKLKRALNRLKVYCEKAKCELSEMSSTNISIKALLPGWDFKHELNRNLFDNLCIDLSEKTIKIMNETLKCAQIEVNDINDILLIGGSTKIPMIQSLLQRYFNKPLKREIKPGETIAYGATIQAALLNAEKSLNAENSNIPLISDVSSCSSKFNSLDDPMAIIIPSNRQIPYQEILDNLSKNAKIERRKTTDGIDNAIKEIEEILKIRSESVSNKRLNTSISHEPLKNNYITGIVYKDLNSEYKALENAKLIYVQEMDKHFIDSKFIIEKELEELHIKYKSLSHNKLETELSSNPINERIEEQFNNTIGKLHDKYKGLNQKNNRSKSAIGIDLGTTYSCVGVINRGKVHIISNTYGLKTTPSYISFTPNGESFVGKSAKEQAHENPTNTIYDVKRMIGRKYNDIDIQKDMKLWPFDIIDENGSLKVKLYSEDHITFLPEQLSAEILSKLKTDAEKFLQFEVKSAVITVPAYFNDAQRQATKEAGILAGLNVLQIINEPTAAAIAYNHQIKEDFRKNVLIYDLGGGTFDVAVVVIENGIIDVKAVNGDTHLGGVDFDQRVLDFLMETFKDKFSEAVDKEKQKRALHRLKINCEKKKWELSEMSSTNIIIDVLLPGWDFKYELTRKTFDDLCIDLFEKTIEIVDETLKCAQMESNEIDDIVLIGGSTKIPKIQTLLQKYFINKPLNNEMNPDEAVAYGATIQAALLNEETFIDSNRTLIHDVSPFSLGIEVFDKTMFVIIPRNSKIPIVKSKTFQTAEDYIDSIQIQIYEGEDIIAKENRLLGNFIIDGFSKKPAGEEKLDVTMEIDKEGILHVEAKSTSKFVDLTVKDLRERISADELKILDNQVCYYIFQIGFY